MCSICCRSTHICFCRSIRETRRVNLCNYCTIHITISTIIGFERNHHSPRNTIKTNRKRYSF
nr:MAG TPA: hypothetical protein [Bacteriophage sp.]